VFDPEINRGKYRLPREERMKGYREDGSISQVYLQHCHRFIIIPSHHCLNLAAAVYLVLYDRIVKQGVSTKEDLQLL